MGLCEMQKSNGHKFILKNLDSASILIPHLIHWYDISCTGQLSCNIHEAPVLF